MSSSPLLLLRVLPVLLLACGGSVAARGGTGDGGKGVDDATAPEKDGSHATCPSPKEVAAQKACAPLGASCPGEPEFNSDCDPLPTLCVCEASGWSCAATGACPPCGYDFPCGGPPKPDAGVDAGVDACKPSVPDQHRPTATTCSATRPPGYNAVAGVDAGLAGRECTSDAQCADGGINGRCTVVHGFFAFCSFDACTTDSDCGPSSVCICGAELPPGEGRNPNECVPAMCLIDSDCGPGGYCSPSPNPCSIPGGNFAGVTAYDCHTATQLCEDQCASNSDCADAGHNCEWRSSATGWACQFGMCE